MPETNPSLRRSTQLVSVSHRQFLTLAPFILSSLLLLLSGGCALLTAEGSADNDRSNAPHSADSDDHGDDWGWVGDTARPRQELQKENSDWWRQNMSDPRTNEINANLGIY